jgi:hypothetical protein
MDFLSELWLPILVSGVAVFVVSSLVHMVLQIHKHDHRALPSDAALAALRGVPPGSYVFPHCTSMEQTKTPEFQRAIQEGPVGFLILRPAGDMGMGKALGQWFVFCLVVGVFTAYLAHNSLPAGAAPMEVLQVTGATSFLAYGLTDVTQSIWKSAPWGNTAKYLFDGLLYALATGACFAFLWPAAV